MFSFKVRPKKLKSYTFSIAIPLGLSCRLSTFLLVILWTIYLDFFTFSDNLFKLSHSLILLSSLFISVSTVSLGFVDLIDCSKADRFVSAGKGHQLVKRDGVPEKERGMMQCFMKEDKSAC